MKYLYITLTLLILSCKKEQKGCLINRSSHFYVENQSKDTCEFILVQDKDTIKESILPYTKYDYTIKAGIITESYLYRADTLYRKSRADFKMKRCEVDGHLIR